MDMDDKQIKILLKYKSDAEEILKQMYEVTIRARKKIDEAKYKELLDKNKNSNLNNDL